MPKITTITPRAKRVWQRLVEWYGTRIIEQYGDAPPEDWRSTIDGADNETIKRGLAIIRSKYLAHPPTLPQFGEAMAPSKKSKGPREITVQEKLCAYISRDYADMLTPKQMRGPWTYIGKQFAAPGADGKLIENHGVEITGVVIDADGDERGYRVMVADMEAAAIDWGRPDAAPIATPVETRTP